MTVVDRTSLIEVALANLPEEAGLMEAGVACSAGELGIPVVGTILQNIKISVFKVNVLLFKRTKRLQKFTTNGILT